MNDAEILDSLRHLVRDKLKTETKLDGELAGHLDNIQRLTLVVAIEDHFEICFDESDEAESPISMIWCRPSRQSWRRLDGHHAHHQVLARVQLRSTSTTQVSATSIAASGRPG